MYIDTHFMSVCAHVRLHVCMGVQVHMEADKGTRASGAGVRVGCEWTWVLGRNLDSLQALITAGP